MNTPCGLTKEELREFNWVDGETGMCNAPFKNVNGETQRGCGELYASHPSSAQGIEQFFLPILFNHIIIKLFLYICMSRLITPSRLTI